jgi:Rieske Fe-S protein
MHHADDSHLSVTGCAQCAAGNPAAVTRRSFFTTLFGLGSTALGIALGIPMVRFLFYPVYASAAERQWSHVGDCTEFANSQEPVSKTIEFSVRDGWREVVSAQTVYVHRTPDGALKVLSAICPHMGCSVEWHTNRDRFVCPCHGGQFDAEGRHIAGPPPRGLDSLTTRVKDGKLQVQFELFRSNTPKQETLS